MSAGGAWSNLWVGTCEGCNAGPGERCHYGCASYQSAGGYTAEPLEEV